MTTAKTLAEMRDGPAKGAKKKPRTSDDLMTHEELAGLLRRFKRARIIVSYYDHPLVRELYAGWTFVQCGITKSLVNQGMRDAESGTPKAPEILIINGPSATGGRA